MKKETKIEMEIEDIEYVLEAERSFVVPFVMNFDISNDEKIMYVEAYSDVADVATDFINKYDGRWFSKQGLDRLDDIFTPYLEKHGYCRDKYGMYRYYRSFIRSNPLSEDELLKIKENTFMLKNLDEDFDNIAGLSSDYGEDLPYESFVTVEDGKIVSVATVNDSNPDSNLIEITVKTNAKYRSKGYGMSNVLALTRYLIEKGVHVAYCCSKNNTASIKLAKKCGFVEIGKIYAVCGFIKD